MDFVIKTIITPQQKGRIEKTLSEMYPGFQIMGSSGPLLEKFGGPLLSFGGPANL